MRFLRACAVTVGPQPGTGVRVDQRFRIAFRIEQDDTSAGNSIIAEVHGLSDATRALFEREDQVVLLEAGYEDSVETLAVMDVTRVWTRRASPEVILVIEGNDGGPKLADRRISVSFNGAVPRSQVLDRIAAEAAMPLRVVEGTDLTGSLQQGWAYAGTVRRALDQLLNGLDVEWAVQDGEIIVKRPGAAVDPVAVLLSPTTGLIRSPERLEDELVDGYAAESLLNPRLRPGVLVQLDSRVVQGQFVVRRVSHQGDTRGAEWITRIEVDDEAA